MIFCEKYNGSVPRIIHSQADFALSGEDMKISAACRAENGQVPDYLYVYVRKGEKYRLLPSDAVTAGGQSYEIYSGYIPAAEVKGEKISYAVGEEGFFSDISDFYTVELIDRAALPAQPPVALSEIYARPKGRGIGAYLEVTNPSDKDTDLYDWEFLLFDKKNKPSGKPSARLPMADAPGTEILHPGEYAAIWGITAKNTDANGREWVTPADFFEDFDSDYVNRNAGYTADDGRVIPVHLFSTDPESGKKVPLAGVGDIPVKNNVVYLCIVPRGADATAAVYHCVYSETYASWDVPVKRSSYWRTDIRQPDTGIAIDHHGMGTPGFAGRGQAYPRSDGEMPVIIPVNPAKPVYIGDGDCVFSFAAVATEKDRRVTDAQVHIRLGDKEKVLEAYEGSDGLWYATLDASFVRRQSGLSYYITAGDGTRCAKCDELSLPVYDNAGPFITSLVPTEGYAFDGRGLCRISASFYDISGTDLGECRFVLDGKTLTEGAVWTPATFECEVKLTAGKHLLDIRLCDCLGNRTEKKISFTVSDMKQLNVYVGEVHSHTAESDGNGFQRDAYAYARDTGKVDYFAATEHSHYIDPVKFEDSLKAADEFDEPGRFATVYGWEMTWNNACGYWGHLNVLGATECIYNINETDYPALLHWMKERPECLGMFNHPGYPWGNFDEFSHRTDEADSVMSLSEIKGPAFDAEYMNMLAKGWHTSPVSNEDNHNPDWTTATKMTGCILAPALTRQNVLDAFRANRTYTTSDRTMKILYRVNGEWLGSRLDNPSKLEFDISITTEKKEGIGLVEIITEDNITVAARNASGIRSFSWKPVLNPDFDYYYIRISGNGQYCVTSPVWLENRGAPVIEGIKHAASYNETDSAAVTAVVKNPTNAAFDDVRVSFLLSAPQGLRLGETEPFKTVCCGKLRAGAVIDVSALIPEIQGLRRITVTVSAVTRSGRRCATAFILQNPVYISAVMPESCYTEKNGKFIDNPFPYVTLYNSSPLEFSLAGGMLRPWVTTGKQPPEKRCLPLDGIVIPPRSTVTLWDRSASAELTAGDFNERYGTALTEGVNLFASQVHFTDKDSDGRRLELCMPDGIMSRVHWNYSYEYDGNPHEDVEHRYVYIPNMTGTAEPSGFRKPRPGYVDEEQAGTRRTVLPGRKDKKRSDKAEKKDAKAERRREKAFFSKSEGAAAAAGAAVIGAALSAATAILLGKKK